MRHRLLVSSIALVAAVVLLFTVPLAIVTRNVAVDRSLDVLAGEARQVGAFLEDARNCAEVQQRLAFIASGSMATTDVAIVTADGRFAVAPGQQQVTVGAELAEAADTGEGRARRDGRLAVAVPLERRVCGDGLVLLATRSDDATAADVRAAWLGIAAVGAVVLALGAAAAAWLGRRLSRPFEDVAAAATRLGEGDFSAGASARSGLPEADAIAEALDVTGDRLGRALERGRSFAADASHQLRTPLTALQLQLEALQAAGADRATVEAAMAEAERLSATIDELGDLTGVDAAPEPVDLGAVVASRLPAWEALAADAGRRLRLERDPNVPRVAVRGAAISQAVAVLLDNAIEHGAGTVTVRVRPDGRESQVRAVRVEVIDEGTGIPSEVSEPGDRADRLPRRGEDGPDDPPGSAASDGRGRGLRLARSLVEAEGGRLSFSSTDEGTCAGIVMPVVGTDAAT